MGTAINLDEIKRFEITEVYSHPDAKVDIVLVHGLNGDPRRSWTATGNGTFWPTQLLPLSLKSAQARVLVYGYNADVYTFGNSKSASSDMIHHHAQTFIANLALERKSEEVEEHPIIFVAHSLGGILVKRALELSNDLTSKNADDNRSIFVSTYGIVFLGTPHNGADPAKWGIILQGMVSALVPKKVLHSESQLVKTLQSNNETLQNINLHFLDIYQKFKICMVHESAPTDLKGTKTIIVDKSSAAPLLPDVLYFGIEATHSGMCKFESKNAPGYTNISQTIKGWVVECGPIIQARWENEKRQRWQIRQAQAAELLGTFPASAQGSTTINTPDPSNSMNNSTIIVKSTASIEPEEIISLESQYFIKPSGFRPNSLFVGRKEELAELHKMLFDKKRRAEGTSAVLIQSLPGGGKTHLVRQYVYDHRQHYPGGIFWLRAKSTTEIAAGFWDIARKAALKHIVEPGEIEAMKADSEHMIRLVKRWLNHRRDWLMVLDGIQFSDKDIIRFIPDSEGCGLIYTSTEKSVSGNHLFMNPQVIKLPLLSAREAQRLLLLELDKREPFSSDDLLHAMELVQAMGLLPVVIHAVAQRLKSTEEPLAKFARNYASEPRLRGIGTYVDVVKRLKTLGAYEALNLVYILCFFSQHIPVEMIVLGLKALESSHIPVKASEPIAGRSLNNTFKVLNTFALIDRNEQELSMQASQSSRSSKSSRNMFSDNVDVIRLHSVVQGFFVDTLHGEGTLPMWLDLAVRVFCCSYDMAAERIARKVNAGLVEDYRLYEIHGIRIHEHLVKQLSKHLKSDEIVVLEEAKKTLEGRLEVIKSEIEERTPESSHVIAVGKSDIFQTSIFDRTSSSSDTGPDTPGVYDRNNSKTSTWGLDLGTDQQSSPISLLYDRDYHQPHFHGGPDSFPPLPMPEDPGYDSDRESATAMTARPSQSTVYGEIANRDGEFQTVSYRRQKERNPRIDLNPPHRSVRNMENKRYRDTAGAWRSIVAIDPRVVREGAPRVTSHETALGFLQRAGNSGDPPRGRISGQSSAEVALARISKDSPPPARGGGMIQDKRSRSNSQVRSGRARMMSGISSYAAAVAGSTMDSIQGWKDGSRPLTAETVQSSSDITAAPERPQSSAIDSLNRFPIAKNSPPLKTDGFLPMPPYPTSPLRQPQSSHRGTYPFPDGYNQENLSLGPNPYPSNIYPRKEGHVPFETLRSDAATASSSPRALSTLTSHAHSEYIAPESHSPPHLSYSSPNIQQDGSYYPGRPELSNLTGGYTSQPMSRDPSGQSRHTAHSADEAERRRPSITETEPLPSLPTFSPKIAPTSYQMHEDMRHVDRESSHTSPRLTREEWEREINQGLAAKKKSPRLEYARAALIGRLEDWGSPLEEDQHLSTVPRRQFNPTAPSFTPSPSSSPYPNNPPVPPNSILSHLSSLTTTTNSSSYPSPYPSPLPPQVPNTTPQSLHSFSGSPGRPMSSAGGEEMGRSGSGGVKIGGGKVIEFGDFPEKVDVDAARERVVRSWRERSERERLERLEREKLERENVGLGIRK